MSGFNAILQKVLGNPELVQLLKSLETGGDPRLGGSLPWGGKTYARGTPVTGVPGWGGTNFKLEDSAHDAAMNYQEARAQDEAQAAGLPFDRILQERIARQLVRK
jgi:hypothetical protein